jgi:hypothetical protein
MSNQNFEALLGQIYAAFNARDIDTALQYIHSEVDWPNGMEGGRVYGHAGIRDYWTRQWGLIDPRVTPLGFVTTNDGRVDVEVHQLVRDLDGTLLKDAIVHHLYTFDDDLIKSMEINEGY